MALITTAQRDQLTALFIGMFKAAPGANNLSDMVAAVESGKTIYEVAATLASKADFGKVYPGFLTGSEFADRVIANLLPSTTPAAAQTWSKDWILGKLNAGESRASIIATAIIALTEGPGVTNTNYADANAQLKNQIEVSNYFSITKELSDSDLSDLQDVIASVTATASSVTAAKNAVDAKPQNQTGQTFTLTTGVDTVQGSAGDDTIVADNTNTAKQLSVADTIGGGNGTDTLKIYMAAGDTSTGAPALTSIEKLYLFGGKLASLNLTTSNFTGVSDVTIDTPDLDNGATNTYTVKGQTITLANQTVATGNTQTTRISSTSDTSETITLNGWTSAGTGTNTLDINGASIASLKLITTGASSKITLTNSGSANLTTLNIEGDKSLTLTESLAGLKTINASAATGAVTLDVTGATINNAFAFTGGAGNDSIKLADNALGTLVAGSQLDGGAGTDKLGIMDTALTTAEYAAINAAKNFETLGINAALALDASQLSTIKSFSLDTNAVQSITNMATGSKVTLAVAHTDTLTLASATGVTDVSLVIGSATSGGLNSSGLLTIGQTQVSVASNGAGTGTNVLNLSNADNSTYTITGSNDLNMGTLAGTNIGSKVDASAFTGKLTVTGSAKSDILIGGSGADTLSAGTITAGVTGVTAVNEVQTVTIGALTGTAAALDTVSITIAGTEVTTAASAYGTAAAVATALKTAIEGNGTTNAIVTVADNGAGVLTLTFKGAQAATDVAAVTVNGDKDAGDGSWAATITETTKGVAAVTAVTASHDVLTGGAGADVFSFQSADLDTTAGVVTATITDFVGGTDTIKTVDAVAGSASNYVEATSAAADLDTLLTAANNALDGVVKYYVGQVGSDSYLVTDSDGTGYTNVIKLTGVALTGISMTDIVA